MNRRPLMTAALGVSLLVLVAAPASASSSAAARYGVINATVTAATDHEIVTSTAFPNYTNGAVDNYYALASSHIDNSPFAEGKSSPLDSGPLGQTAAAGNFQQPQYADARWPGSKASGKATFGSPGGPYAVSTAARYFAAAQSSDVSGGSNVSGTPSLPSLPAPPSTLPDPSTLPGASSLPTTLPIGTGGIPTLPIVSSLPGSPPTIASPQGFTKRLRRVLAAWQTKWAKQLNPTSVVSQAGSGGVPDPGSIIGTVTTVVSGVTSPPKKKSGKSPVTANAGGLVAETVAELNPKTGVIVTTGESSLGQIDIASKLIVLKGIHVVVAITNSSHPRGTATVDVAGGSIAGLPIAVGEHGVRLKQIRSGLPYGPMDKTLNAALKQAGVEIYTVTPKIKKGANELTITATGVHVVFTQPVNQSGVPSQTVEHIVGEVSADSLAAPAPPVPKLSLGGTGSTSGVVGSGTSGLSSGGSSIGSSSAPASSLTSGSSSPSSFITSALSKPWWLLAAYLVWQVLMIATGASLWRWRRGRTLT